MTLPPWWYVLLIGTTLLAAPFLLRRAGEPRKRQLVVALLGGLALYEMGLVLLFYSKLVCWLLVTAGVATIATAGTRTRPWTGALVLLPPALVAGLAFQFLPEYADFFLYFSIGIPLLLATAFAFALHSLLRASTDRRTLLLAVSLVLFAALTPASAFAFTFLRHYEIFHLPALLLVLASLWTYTRPPRAEADTARMRLAGTAGDRAASAFRRNVAASVLILCGALVAAPVFGEAPLAGAVAVAGWGLFVVAALGAFGAALLRARVAPLLAVAAALAGVGAALLGARAGAEAFQSIGGGPAPESVLFYIAGLGIALFALGGTLALGAARDTLHLRRHTRPPPSAWTMTTTTLPTVHELETLRDRLRRDGRPVGIVDTTAPLQPLDGLPPVVHAWLVAERPGPRIHLAVHEGHETFYIPDLEADPDA